MGDRKTRFGTKISKDLMTGWGSDVSRPLDLLLKFPFTFLSSSTFSGICVLPMPIRTRN